MKDSEAKELFRRLSEAPGAPGAEDAVRQIVAEQLDGLGEISYDGLGSLVCELSDGTERPRVSLDAHIDEVALMVQSIDSGGRLKFVALGGWWEHVLLAQRVDVHARSGVLPGVIGSVPPHFLAASERTQVRRIEQLSVDIGCSSAEEARALGVRPGDPVVPRAELLELGNPGTLCGKAFDNRVGVTLLCDLARSVGRDHPNRLVAVASVQEELGLRGATTSAALTRPDVAIVLECSPADDDPQEPAPQGRIGGGPQLRLFDPTALPNRRLARYVEAVAEENDIPLQLAVRRSGGTDAGAIHRSGTGVPTAVVAVPARYIHSHGAVLRWEDYVATRKLLLAVLRGLDGERVAELTRFGTTVGEGKR